MKIVIVLVLAFITPTFAQQQPTQTTSQAPDPVQEQKATNPSPPIAHLHVYRPPEFEGSALYPSIYVDGQQVVRVGNGRRVTIKLTVGSHDIKSDDKKTITLDVTAGQDYFIRVNEVQGFPKGKGKVTLVSAEKAAPEYNMQRPIEQSRMIVSEMIEAGGVPWTGSKIQAVSSAPQQPETSASASAPITEGLPEGFVLYDGSKEQFTLGIPHDWKAYDQGQMMKAQGMKAGRFDMVRFLPAKDFESTMFGGDALKADTGEVPSFFVQKLPADKDMSCAGFSEKTEKKLVDIIGKDRDFKGKNALELAHAEPAVVGACKGIRVRAKGQPSAGSPVVADAYIASDGQTIYIFSLRNRAEYYDKNVGVFQKAVSTIKLSAAK